MLEEDKQHQLHLLEEAEDLLLDLGYIKSRSRRPVLIADQDPAVRKFISEILEKINFPIISLETCQEVKECFQKSPLPLAMFLNMKLPQGGGAALLDHLKKSESLALTGVIGTAGECSQQELKAYLQSPIDGLLWHPIKKPFFIRYLFQYSKPSLNRSTPQSGKLV